MNPFPDKLLLFDGVCNLCNRSVQFVIKHAPADKFYFASLQSESGQAFCRQYGITDQKIDSFIYFEGDKVYTMSTAALRVARQLKRGWSLLYVFIIVPPFIRDAVYRLIARNRYRWFGKRAECMVPSEVLRKRFLQ